MMRAEFLRPGVAVLAAVWLAGCATTQLSRVPLAPEAELALLMRLEDFSLNGRTFVAAGEKPVNASMSWRQRGPEARIRLSGPVGVGSVTLTHGPGVLRVEGSRGEDLEGADALAVVERELGFLPPFESLRWWVLGLPAPDSPPDSRTDDPQGRPLELVQGQWKIRYSRWMQVGTRQGAVQLPKLVIATRDDLQLRLVVDRWKLD